MLNGAPQHIAYGQPRPPSSLSKMIHDGLHEHLPGLPVDPSCIDLETQRHHLLKLDSSSWGAGMTIGRDDEGWPLCAGPYWRHVRDCPNTFHLEPVITETTYAKGSRHLIMTFRPQKRGGRHN